MRDRLIPNNFGNNDGIDRRGFLKCMAWAGTGVLWAMSGGVLRSYGLSRIVDPHSGAVTDSERVSGSDFTFVQISDSHIGFTKEANPDVAGTLRAAIGKINALPVTPPFMLHTGDLSHLSRTSEFDTLDQLLKEARPGKIFFVPGEHDVLADNGKEYRDRYGKGTRGNGWYSFDFQGTHFVGLVNVLDLKPGGLGNLGEAQLAWLKDDLAAYTDSVPVVVFAHVPLWSVFPPWGWGTDDAGEALSCLRRFGSVTVLNGHIHQVMQKIEGNISFHTAMSTAFPQPSPGSAPSPGPMKVPDDRLRALLGLATVNYLESNHSLAIIDSPLLSTPAGEKADRKEGEQNGGTGKAGANEVTIDNFTFMPELLQVKTGARVVWINRDDVPHTVVSVERKFASPALDTDDRFSFTFAEAGRYNYYCSVHPHMRGAVVAV